MKHIILYFACLFFPLVAFAAPNDVNSPEMQAAYDNAQTYEDVMAERPRNDTKCATAAFEKGLAQYADKVSESDPEEVISEWIQLVFADKAVLNAVLACPEVASVADDETIIFLPIKYKFPGGREIVINYETQPKIFKQRILMADKRKMPSSNPNPRIGGEDDDSVWTHTDPSWYGVMVVEHGAFDNFVGPDKNNTISLAYIRDNIDDLYPSGHWNGGRCTSRSAIAADHRPINKAGKGTTGDDSNDYYVAGDVNLQWIAYLEMAAEVIFTVATAGGYAFLAGATKAVQIPKVMHRLGNTLKTLRKSDKVIDWVKTTNRIDKIKDEIKALDKIKDADKIKDLNKEMDTLTDTAKKLEKTKDVEQYKDVSKTYSELNKTRHALKNARKALRFRGNVVARAPKVFKGFRAAMKGNKAINHGAKLARSSNVSGRIRDWLFHSTWQNAGALAKAGALGGILYGALRFAGDMFDYTETSTGEFTSGEDFSPLLLLSADELKGQENVVNHGMWLMWMGDAMTIEDDDAAYLQAMDFAAKFHQELMEQQGNSNDPCNVDIYVGHPILRNPGTDNAEIYYLIMNDEPWTTAK